MKEHHAVLVKMSLIFFGQAEGQFDCYQIDFFPSKVVYTEVQFSQENKQKTDAWNNSAISFLDSADLLCILLWETKDSSNVFYRGSEPTPVMIFWL